MTRHDCEAWAMEGIGCAHCNPIAQENRDHRHSLLKRAEQAEAERDRLKAELAIADEAMNVQAKMHASQRQRAEAERDRLDCTRREGGDTRHCRHDRPCLRCERDRLKRLSGEQG